MSEQPEGLYYIPKNAKIPVEIGSGFLLRLQKALVFLISDKSPQEIQELQDHIKNNTVPEDTWMDHFLTIQTLVTVTEQTAIQKKMTTSHPD